MYSKSAIASAECVSNDPRQIISGLMVWNMVLKTQLKLLYSSVCNFGWIEVPDLALDLAGDLVFLASNVLAYALSAYRAVCTIGNRWFVSSHADNCNTI